MYTTNLILKDMLALSAVYITEYDQDIVYPADLTRGAQVTLPSRVLNQSSANGKFQNEWWNIVRLSIHFCRSSSCCHEQPELFLTEAKQVRDLINSQLSVDTVSLLTINSTSETDTTCVASSVLSTQVTTPSGIVTQFGDNQNITMQFLTDGVSEDSMHIDHLLS